MSVWNIIIFMRVYRVGSRQVGGKGDCFNIPYLYIFTYAIPDVVPRLRVVILRVSPHNTWELVAIVLFIEEAFYDADTLVTGSSSRVQSLGARDKFTSAVHAHKRRQLVKQLTAGVTS